MESYPFREEGKLLPDRMYPDPYWDGIHPAPDGRLPGNQFRLSSVILPEGTDRGQETDSPADYVPGISYRVYGLWWCPYGVPSIFCGGSFHS